VTSVAMSSHASPACSSRYDLLPVLYAAEVAHTRRAPIANNFRYRAGYWLVDFDRLPRPRGILRFLARFERSDHSDIRAFLAEHGIQAERVLMLAAPRTLGYVFNPISVFWSYDANETQSAVVVEVHNTYGDRHTYLLQPDERGRSRVNKEMYVSPFYPVDGYYDIRVSEPGRSVAVTVTLRRGNDLPFVATLRGERRAADTLRVVTSSLMYPALRTSILIRWQALRLWLRGMRVQKR
jgi:DUF1365 family protein